MEDVVKDLVWKPCEDYELTYLESANSLSHAYIVIEDGSKYKVSYYPLAGGHAKPATGFNTVKEAKDWCFNHWVEKVSPYIKNVYYY